MEFASFDHADIAAGAGMDNKSLKFKDLLNHNSGSVAAVAGSKNVTVYMVRVVCDTLETWGPEVYKQQRSNCRALLKERDDSRQFCETPRYTHDSSSHSESAIKEVEKQMRFMIFHTLVADHKYDTDKHTAWTITHYRVKADGQTSLFKLMSKDYHGEVAKFSELSWFRSTAKQLKLAEHRKEAESENGTRHISYQTKVHHESSVGQTRACTTLHKMLLGHRSVFA